MPSPSVWEDIRRVHQDGKISVTDILAKFNITQGALTYRIRREDWPRRPSPIKSGAIKRTAVASSTPPPTLADLSAEPSHAPEAELLLSPPAPASPAKKTVLTSIAHRRALVKRLYAAIDTKLSLLERRFASEMASLDAGKTKAISAADNERDTRTIGTLIKTLEQVTEYDHGHESGKRIPGGTAAKILHGAAAKSAAAASASLADETDRLRRELGDRLQRLVETAEDRA